MNNEPVAWVDPYDLERLTHYDCHIGSQKMKNGIPLYTHLVELTDEEIAQEWGKFYPDVFHTHLIDFARAILRKASEK